MLLDAVHTKFPAYLTTAAQQRHTVDSVRAMRDMSKDFREHLRASSKAKSAHVRQRRPTPKHLVNCWINLAAAGSCEDGDGELEGKGGGERASQAGRGAREKAQGRREVQVEG